MGWQQFADRSKYPAFPEPYYGRLAKIENLRNPKQPENSKAAPRTRPVAPVEAKQGGRTAPENTGGNGE